MAEQKQKKSKIKMFAKICTHISLLFAVVALGVYFAVETKETAILIVSAVFFVLSIFDMIMLSVNKNKEDLSILTSVLILVFNIPLCFLFIIVVIADFAGGTGVTVDYISGLDVDDKKK